MEKLFKLKAHGTTVKRELLAGLTTFFAMAYIIAVNPNFLSTTGMDFNAVVLATCISAGIGCLLTAFIANVPFAQAAGMGLNTFFAFTVCGSMGYTWNQALTIVLISGFLFLIVTISPLRKTVIAAIPAPLKSAIGVGIGLFLAYIGLVDSGIATFNGVPAMGNITGGSALLCLIGVIVTAVLMVLKVKGAIVLGIVVSTLVGIPMGLTFLPESFTFSASLAPTFFAFDFKFLTTTAILPLITAIISFAIVDMFDTVGTLIAAADQADMIDKDGNLRGGDKALIADAIATCAGACLGTSTVTTYIESSTGISEGGRTGLTAMTTGLLFFAACILAPVIGIIPRAATCPAVVIVGVLMLSSVKKIDWSDFEAALPAFLTIAMMPFTYSIANGIGFGFISYTLLKVCHGKAKEVSATMYVLTAIFIAKFVLSGLM
ncbi:MAG: NCS2 family permease [Oscillospiraceae bacterium]